MAQHLNFIMSTLRMTLGLAVILIISDQVKVIHAELDCTSIRCPPAPDCPNDSYLKDIDTSFDDAANDPFMNIHYERLFDPIPPHDTDTTPSRHKIAATQQHYDIEADENEARYKREAAEMPLEYADGNADDEDADESDDIERCCQQSECTCNECHMVECPRNHVAIELSTGKGTPGQCCSTYKCVPDWECKADAELRANISAKQIYWRNECTKCECIRGKELCFRVCQQQQEDTSCYSRNLRSPMEDGSRWMEDPCTSCWCNRGEPRCQMSVCAPPACKSPVQMPDRCCPVCVETAETTAKTTERPNLTTSTESTESESSSTTTTAISTSIFSTSESTVEPEETTLSTTDNETESSDKNETTMTDETVSETTAAASSSDASAEDSTDEPTSSSTEPNTPSTEQTSDALTSESTSVTDSTTEGTSSSQSTETSPSKFFSTETSPTFTSDAPFRVIGSSSSTTAPEWPSTSTESPESSSPSSTVQTEGPALSSAESKMSTSAPIAEVQATLLTAVKEQSDLERDWLFIFKVFIAVFGIGAFVTVLVLLKKCVYVRCFNQNPLKNGTSSDRITYTPVSGSEVSSQSSASRIQCMVDVEKLGYGKAN